MFDFNHRFKMNTFCRMQPHYHPRYGEITREECSNPRVHLMLSNDLILLAVTEPYSAMIGPNDSQQTAAHTIKDNLQCLMGGNIVCLKG